jgi:CRISPR-associated protein Cas2
MRRRFVVCYDISDPKRLTKVFHKMKGFGDPLQKSVFTCDLSPAEKVMMISAMTDIMNMKEDSIIIIDTGPTTAKRQSLEYMGKPILPQEGSAAIIV